MGRSSNHVLVPAGAGALLLDLESGALVELNESAAFIWHQFIAGDDRASIVRQVSSRYGIDRAVADGHVADALRVPDGAPEASPTDFNYRLAGDHYVFELHEQPVLTIDLEGDEVALCPQAHVTAQRLGAILHAVAPKILSLRGHVVLHAAAVAIENRVMAFSGLSGAGKSTTARAFVAAGANPVCDDQLVVDLSVSPITVGRTAEAAIDQWIACASSELITAGRAQCAGLDRVQEAEPLILAEIGFLARERRQGSGYFATELSATNVAGQTFRNAFHGSNEATYWKRTLDRAARLGAAVKGFALTPPTTIEALRNVAATLASAGSLRG